MGIAVVLIVAVILIALWIHSMLHKRSIIGVSSGTMLVKQALWEKLQAKFAPQFPGEFSEFLAAAVVNDLFCEVTDNPEAAKFRVDNLALVQAEARALSEDREVRNVLTQTMRVLSVATFAVTKNLPAPEKDLLARITEYGILIPGGEFPSHERFALTASEFYRKHHKQVAR
jgi:hypothetical protein